MLLHLCHDTCQFLKMYPSILYMFQNNSFETPFEEALTIRVTSLRLHLEIPILVMINTVSNTIRIEVRIVKNCHWVSVLCPVTVSLLHPPRHFDYIKFSKFPT